MKATEEFKNYRCVVLGISKKDFRELQAGKDVDVSSAVVAKFPNLFKKEIKHGSTK